MSNILKELEFWAVVQEAPLYLVSTFGRVFNTVKNRFLKPTPDRDGYLKVFLKVEGDRKRLTRFVHRLVAIAFIKNDDPENKKLINHKDETRDNNCVWNLEWCDHSYNINYGSCIQKMLETRKRKRITTA